MITSVPKIWADIEHLYKKTLLPIEEKSLFHDLQSPKIDNEKFAGVPVVMFVGPYSTGKTTFINYLLGDDYPGSKSGLQPSTDQFVLIVHNEKRSYVSKSSASLSSKFPTSMFEQTQNEYFDKLVISQLPNELVRSMTIIDSPGICGQIDRESNEYKQYIEALEMFASKCDRIYLIFDAFKIDIPFEIKELFMKIDDIHNKVRIVLNKADLLDQREMIRMYGSFMWFLCKELDIPLISRIFIGSFWNFEYQNKFFKNVFIMEERDLINDLTALPIASVDTIISDMVERAYKLLVHVLVMNELAKKKQKYLIKSLSKKITIHSIPKILKMIEMDEHFSIKYFPDALEFMKKFEAINLDNFEIINETEIKKIKEFLIYDIPKLQTSISHDSYYIKKSLIRTRTFSFENLNQSEENDQEIEEKFDKFHVDGLSAIPQDYVDGKISEHEDANLQQNFDENYQDRTPFHELDNDQDVNFQSIYDIYGRERLIKQDSNDKTSTEGFSLTDALSRSTIEDEIDGAFNKTGSQELDTKDNEEAKKLSESVEKLAEVIKRQNSEECQSAILQSQKSSTSQDSETGEIKNKFAEIFDKVKRASNESIFKKLKNFSDKISLKKVQKHFLNDGVDHEALLKICQLADSDNDSYLNFKEFSLFCYLVEEYKKNKKILDMPLEEFIKLRYFIMSTD